MASLMVCERPHARLSGVDVDSDGGDTVLAAGRSANGGAGARRAVAAAVGLLTLGSVLVATWAAEDQVNGGRSLRKGNVTVGVGLSSAAELGKELFDANVEIFNGDYGSNEREGSQPIANAPVENLHDGNVCDDDEEMFGHLCYKKCSLLTNGQYPLRSSAWSCCTSGSDGKSKCGLFDQKVSPWICSGLDVGGDRAGNGCPHPAGACLENEEVHLGRCFKKCSELTNGEYPTRIAAATCCKSLEAWKCLDIMNVKTRDAFDVGGGMGDGDSRTPRRPHFPMKSVTEIAD